MIVPSFQWSEGFVTPRYHEATVEHDVDIIRTRLVDLQTFDGMSIDQSPQQQRPYTSRRG